MNRTPNTTEKTNAQPVFNYAQAAKRSSQNLESQKPKTNTSTPANESKSPEAEAAKVESPSSFAAALSKNAQSTSYVDFLLDYLISYTNFSLIFPILL